MSDTRTAQEIELANLNAARKILLGAMGNIPGVGPDWKKAENALKYIDSKRDPILAELLAAPVSEEAALEGAA